MASGPVFCPFSFFLLSCYVSSCLFVCGLWEICSTLIIYKVELSESKGPKKPSLKLFVGNITEATSDQVCCQSFTFTPIISIANCLGKKYVVPRKFSSSRFLHNTHHLQELLVFTCLGPYRYHFFLPPCFIDLNSSSPLYLAEFSCHVLFSICLNVGPNPKQRSPKFTPRLFFASIKSSVV